MFFESTDYFQNSLASSLSEDKDISFFNVKLLTERQKDEQEIDQRSKTYFKTVKRICLVSNRTELVAKIKTEVQGPVVVANSMNNRHQFGQGYSRSLISVAVKNSPYANNTKFHLISHRF